MLDQRCQRQQPLYVYDSPFSRRAGAQLSSSFTHQHPLLTP